MSNKYTASDAFKQEAKLKKDYLEILTHLLTSTASILSDSFKIEFDKSYGFKIVFSPTVYELLRRFSQVLEQNNVNLSTTLAVRNEIERQQQKPADSDDDLDEDEETSKFTLINFSIEGDKDLANSKNFGFGHKSRLTIG